MVSPTWLPKSQRRKLVYKDEGPANRPFMTLTAPVRLAFPARLAVAAQARWA
jgi:hypothetical protein